MNSNLWRVTILAPPQEFNYTFWIFDKSDFKYYFFIYKENSFCRLLKTIFLTALETYSWL